MFVLPSRAQRLIPAQGERRATQVLLLVPPSPVVLTRHLDIPFPIIPARARPRPAPQLCLMQRARSSLRVSARARSLLIVQLGTGSSDRPSAEVALDVRHRREFDLVRLEESVDD